ncbi:phenylalanine--tRNA ligase beta subunit-related protein [Companilactobacillus sp.]|uniref:B3/B4 domain-containing protein n=1 Tax=Companilactobacillus sp. TaxID=2767905 RepID=UPI00263185C3|nr:phenylalanine--tRNA ligase beta subunit-related protein [Companilactobacillus sp.]
MKNIVIDPEFWNLFPEGQISILRLQGIDNKVDEKDDPYFQKLLDAATEESKKYLTDDTFRLNPVVDQWREALRKFKTKKGARSSIEALLKRVSQGKSFSPINPLVDIYNSISLKYGTPCGGENVDKMDGDLHLGMAKGGEGFRPLGDDEDSPALEGEIIYYDKTGAICRCMNWRKAQRTMLTEDTTNAVMVIEAINDEQAKRSDDAIIELKQLCEDYFKVSGKIAKLTNENPTAEIE